MQSIREQIQQAQSLLEQVKTILDSYKASRETIPSPLDDEDYQIELCYCEKGEGQSTLVA